MVGHHRSLVGFLAAPTRTTGDPLVAGQYFGDGRFWTGGAEPVMFADYPAESYCPQYHSE
jgi:hypothetical protein